MIYLDPLFAIEVVVSGLLSGIMYSLVALGFALIFKASGIFNFAQGAFVLFAALTLVSLIEGALFGVKLPLLLAAAVTLVIMVVYGMAVERLVLRPLINQSLIILFMATIGLNFFTEGFAQMLWGAQVKRLDLGIPEKPWEGLRLATGITLSVFELVAAAIAGVLVLGLTLFFSKTTTGRALRAVSDDNQAAMSVGIPLQHIWAVVWAVAGIIALVAGMLWGAKLGVQFSLSLLALKALPVLIIGGFDSIVGVIVAGLIVGASEKFAEVFVGPYFGGAIENWFPYVLATVVLLIKPQGLFGEKIIERV
ncbi:MAG: branched-chain amino acid ABC transporter permease [Alphaproteobacteria bacterium]|nr:branched-chain amino acid ABC transporter permease [Alphaproteobacteria bacterium]